MHNMFNGCSIDIPYIRVTVDKSALPSSPRIEMNPRVPTQGTNDFFNLVHFIFGKLRRNT